MAQAQNDCFESKKGGHHYMRASYDRMPKTVRDKLKESPFNICPACVMKSFSEEGMLYRIACMVDKIRLDEETKRHQWECR